MVIKSITVIHIFFLSWLFVVAPGTAFGEVLLDDDFEAGLNLGVWDVRQNRGAQWECQLMLTYS